MMRRIKRKKENNRGKNASIKVQLVDGEDVNRYPHKGRIDSLLLLWFISCVFTTVKIYTYFFLIKKIGLFYFIRFSLVLDT